MVKEKPIENCPTLIAECGSMWESNYYDDSEEHSDDN